MGKQRDDWLSAPIGEENGERIFRCRWTGENVRESEACASPTIVPGVNGAWPAVKGFEKARRISYIAFAENERSCNTCRHLERVKHEKDPHGFLYGKCKSTPINHPYPQDDGGIKFHPDDPMLMECYESRFNQQSICG